MKVPNPVKWVRKRLNSRSKLVINERTDRPYGTEQSWISEKGPSTF